MRVIVQGDHTDGRIELSGAVPMRQGEERHIVSELIEALLRVGEEVALRHGRGYSVTWTTPARVEGSDGLATPAGPRLVCTASPP